MQAVRRLVRLDPDQRRLHLVDRAVEGLQLDALVLLREHALELRVGPRHHSMLRPTRFSNMRLCDSCSASDVPRHSGVRSSDGSTLCS